MPLDITNWRTPANIIANVICILLPDDFQLGNNLFVGFMPDKPANCITIIDIGGGEQDPINKIDNHSIQILGRNKDYQLGYNLLNKIKAILQSIDTETFQTAEMLPLLDLLNDYVEESETSSFESQYGHEKVIGIWVKSNIAFLKRDESANSLFSSNYRVMIDTNKNINRN